MTANLRELLKAATARPWSITPFGIGVILPNTNGFGSTPIKIARTADAAAIVAVMNAAEALLDIVDDAKTLAMVHVQDGDELGEIARRLIERIARAALAGGKP